MKGTMLQILSRLPRSKCLPCLRRSLSSRPSGLNVDCTSILPRIIPHSFARASYGNRHFFGTHSSFKASEKSGHSNLSNLDQKPGDVKSQDSPVGSESLSIFGRFRQTYRQYGKILVGVHICTSAAWACTFGYIAVSGFDVIALLKWFGASEKVIAPFSSPGVGYAAITYLMFKLASPLRYAVTIGGTHLTVRALQRLGYMPPVPPEERIRSLVKEKFDDIKERRSKDHRL